MGLVCVCVYVKAAPPAGSPMHPPSQKGSPAQGGPAEKKTRAEPTSRCGEGAGQCCLQDGVTSHQQRPPLPSGYFQTLTRNSTAMTGGSFSPRGWF